MPLFEVDWPRFRDGPFFDGFKFLYDQLSDSELEPEALADQVADWPSGHGDSSLEGHFGPHVVEQRTTALLVLDPKTLQPPMAGELFGGVNIRQILSAVKCPVHLLAGNRENGSALTSGDLDEFSGLCLNGSIHRFEALGHDIRLFDEGACLVLLNSSSLVQ